jgi:hypothetical protein
MVQYFVRFVHSAVASNWRFIHFFQNVQLFRLILYLLPFDSLHHRTFPQLLHQHLSCRSISLMPLALHIIAVFLSLYLNIFLAAQLYIRCPFSLYVIAVFLTIFLHLPFLVLVYILLHP